MPTKYTQYFTSACKRFTKPTRTEMLSGVMALGLLALVTLPLLPKDQARQTKAASSCVGSTITWDNTSGDGLWSTATNWSGDVLPGSTDIVVFDATSTTDSTIDASFAGTICDWTVDSAYTGTITFINEYSGGLHALHATGDVTFNGGTLTHSGNLTTEAYRLKLTVSGALNIASGVSITGDALAF